MTAGPRSHPPELRNFRHLGYLGGGGFADVFLYEQLRPSRQVALKVLRNVAIDGATQQGFDAEADLMAKVSAHPYIVTIFGADVAPDGRPFLVMEYYPRPHFGLQAKQGPLPVSEVLQVGVRLASAVETAHRAGILHRDIKPANVLVSQYGRPGLTDFGIAGARDLESAAESQGVSVPYAPPEVLADRSPGDERSDVYSLAATLYTLLAARSPFEIPNGDNALHSIAQRVLHLPVPPIQREDVPTSLELLLAQALSKDPAQRPRSAAELGRALQGIERELGHAPTEFELADDGSASLPSAARPADDDSTRAARLQVVRQMGGADPPTAPKGGEEAAIAKVPTTFTSGEQSIPVREPLPVPMAPAAADTQARVRPAPVHELDDAPAPRRRPLWPMVGAAGVLAVIVGGVAVAALGGGGDAGTAPTTTAPVEDEAGLSLPDTPPVPVAVTVTLAGTVATVTWDPGPDAQEDDTYLVLRTDGPTDDAVDVVDGHTIEVTVGEGERPCFKVSAQRGPRSSIEVSEEGCAQ